MRILKLAKNLLWFRHQCGLICLQSELVLYHNVMFENRSHARQLLLPLLPHSFGNCVLLKDIKDWLEIGLELKFQDALVERNVIVAHILLVEFHLFFVKFEVLHIIGQLIQLGFTNVVFHQHVAFEYNVLSRVTVIDFILMFRSFVLFILTTIFNVWIVPFAFRVHDRVCF